MKKKKNVSLKAVDSIKFGKYTELNLLLELINMNKYKFGQIRWSIIT